MPTKVFYKQDKGSNFKYIIIKDHADFAEQGKDIVCAAISAITNGTINFLQVNYSDSCKIIYNSAEITINLQKVNYECQLCLRLMIYQLKNIADFYPNYLKINKNKNF
ncbi:MAG: ribosomal-processing cysteine protease Prp [Spiroplasmataceae bacterium]|jgi:uncharacterized protein YsxB (DUF464 family)|nr:ribosomal-processing cysteine protease Prp [Spiroplasmataceae bacterium]